MAEAYERLETADNDIVLMTEFQHFEGLVHREAVIDQVRGFPLAHSLVWGSNSKVMSRLLYPLGEQAKCHLGVGWIVQSLRIVDVGKPSSSVSP